MEDLTQQQQAAVEEVADATERRIRRLTAILVLGVACLAFAVSFEAIRDYAANSGAVAPQLAWVIPLLVDTFIVVASLAIWLRSLDGERAWLPMALLISAACGSLLLNVAHAPHRLAAQAVSAIPPAALIASFHVAMSELRRAHKRKREAAARMAAFQAMANGPGPGLTSRSTTATFGSPAGQGQLMRPLGARTAEPRELVRHLWEEHELRGGESLTAAAVERMSGGQISRRRAQGFLRSIRAEHRSATQQDGGPPTNPDTAALPPLVSDGDKNGHGEAESVFGSTRR